MSLLHSLSSLAMKLEEEEENDGPDSSSDYVTTLRHQQQHARQVMENEEKEFKTLTEYLPVYDRIDLTKESKVLEIWQQRQREWESVKRTIHSKVRKNTQTKELLMDSIDNYRPKVEEYDTIQAARPLRERFWAESWSSTLRGGNTSRVVTIGNMYSGLECVIDKPLLPPIMVRKPASEIQMKTMSGQLSLFDSNTSKSIESRKIALEKGLSKIRPHTLKSDHIESLVIASTDLFEWAIDSAEEYFSNQNFNSQRIDESNISFSDAMKEDQPPSLEVVKPKVEFLSPSVVVFSNRGQQTAKNVVSFRNDSDISVLYRWDRYYSIAAASQTESTLAKSSSIPREFQLRNHRNHFTCSQQEGIILPGSTMSTQFTFNDNDLSGLFQERWKLSCCPNVIITQSQDLEMVRSSELQENSIIVSLHGMMIDVDESKHFRSQVSSSLHDGVDLNYVRDVIEECISRVRSPLTIETLHQREIAYFLDTNKAIIDEVKSSSLNQSLNMHMNIHRIRNIEAFCKSFLPFRVDVAKRYFYLSHIINEPDGKLVCRSSDVDEAVFSKDDLSKINEVLGTHANQEILDRIQAHIFPEKSLVRLFIYSSRLSFISFLIYCL
jgi:hypothetical protein